MYKLHLDYFGDYCLRSVVGITSTTTKCTSQPGQKMLPAMACAMYNIIPSTSSLSQVQGVDLNPLNCDRDLVTIIALICRQ